MLKIGDQVTCIHSCRAGYEETGTIIDISIVRSVSPYHVDFEEQCCSGWYAEDELVRFIDESKYEEVQLTLDESTLEFVDEVARLAGTTDEIVLRVVLAQEAMKYKNLEELPPPQPPIVVTKKEKKVSSDNLRILKQYIRANEREGSKGDPVGVMLASYDQTRDRIVVGWSLCHSHKDVFNKNVGTGIAFDRMRTGQQCHVDDVPHSIQYQLTDFTTRATKYFQTLSAVVCK